MLDNITLAPVLRNTAGSTRLDIVSESKQTRQCFQLQIGGGNLFSRTMPSILFG